MTRWKPPVVLALISIALGACQHTTGCPALKTYTRAQMQAVAAEIAKNPDSDTARFIADYGQLRAGCRVLN